MTLIIPLKCNVLLGNSAFWHSHGCNLTKTPKHLCRPSKPQMVLAHLDDIGPTGQCILYRKVYPYPYLIVHRWHVPEKLSLQASSLIRFGSYPSRHRHVTTGGVPVVSSISVMTVDTLSLVGCKVVP